MIVIISDKLSKNFGGITIYPFIFLKRKHINNEVFINHEKIHLKQQGELLIILFFIVYILNYLTNLFKYKTLDEAYKNVIFEREAYQNEKNLDYLK